MIDSKQDEAVKLEAVIARLRELLERATPGPWQLQDGCSWRRIGTAFHDGDVLCPDTYSREDRHPDLTARDGRLYDNLRLIVEGINALPTLLDAATLPPANLGLYEALTHARNQLEHLQMFPENVRDEATNKLLHLVDAALRKAGQVEALAGDDRNGVEGQV